MEIFELLQVLVLSVLIPIALVVIWKISEKYGIYNAILANQELAMIVVKLIAVTYTTLDGPQKLEKAVEELSKMLESRGIKLSPEEIKALCQDAYDKWVQEWKELEDNPKMIEARLSGKYK